MVAVALVGAACDGRSPAWNEADHRRIYEAVLQSMRSHLSLDTLIVDPRPRFLVEEAGSLSMGDYSRYGDPYFSEAIRNTPAVTACDIQRGVGCDTSVHRRLATVSEILVVGPREAGVLSAVADLVREPIDGRTLVMHLRFSGGQWRVVRIEEGSSVSAAGGTPRPTAPPARRAR